MYTAIRPLLVALLVPTALAAQATTETGGFVVRLGKDTIAVERYTRTADRLEGDFVTRGQLTVTRHYVVTLGADGSVLRFEGTSRPVGAAAAPTTLATATFRGDSAIVEIKRGDSTQTLRLATAAPAVPFLNNSFALYELAARRAHPVPGGQPAPVALVPLGAPQAFPATVARLGVDSVALLIPPQQAPYRLRVDAAGRIVGATGRGTTQQVAVERVASLDVAALAAAWATKPLGTLSPRDTVRATVGGASLTVDYSRPAVRGREIFGNVVPWNQVWRTGANAATIFTTSADLDRGGTTIPAGSYSLWTIPSPSGWMLIINKNTGQWGTEYDVKYDLVRLDMQVQALAQPVEQFTIAIEPQGAGGVLKMAWEKTQVSLPFTKK